MRREEISARLICAAYEAFARGEDIDAIDAAVERESKKIEQEILIRHAEIEQRLRALRGEQSQ